jgi:sorbitol-specific phosphotransferase system component IIC
MVTRDFMTSTKPSYQARYSSPTSSPYSLAYHALRTDHYVFVRNGVKLTSRGEYIHFLLELIADRVENCFSTKRIYLPYRVDLILLVQQLVGFVGKEFIHRCCHCNFTLG